MRRPSPRLRQFASAALPAAAAVLLWFSGGSQVGEEDPPDGVILVPFAVDGVRALVPVDAKVLVYHRGDQDATIRLEELRVLAGGDLVERVHLDVEVPGDREYGDVNALMERLPHEVSHLHREGRYFAPADAPEIPMADAFRRLEEVYRRVAFLRKRYEFGVPLPFAEPAFVLPLDQLFRPEDPIGERAQIEIEVDYVSAAGDRRTATVSTDVTWLGPWPGLTDTFIQSNAGIAVHSGDLHVHSCHGEAANACAPSTNCAAESFQTSGSFTYSQLKTQYQALGLDWFTATDHSYCINSDAEYNAIVAEVAAITDASFLSMPDIELSSDEQGPQVGSDLGDLLCFGSTSANHMGAHGISQRMTGGSDGFLGFCGGLNGFQSNATAVRAQGGYPIANHPQAGSFGWNSFDSTQGIEAGQLHGVEIWNGASASGQGSHVGDWVDWLLGGRILYAYSGSDTHDAAFDFGANHALVEGAFTIENVETALKAGRVYVSNGPSLVIEVDLGGSTIPMGDIHALPTPTPAAPVLARAHYDFGADTGTVTLFHGAVGGGSETTLCQTSGLTGQGFVECAHTLSTGARSWYRAYAENAAGNRTAYSNPVFFDPRSEDVFAYCTGKLNSQGCVATIGWTGVPSVSAGSGFEIQATEVLNQQFGILIYAYQPDFLPFDDTTLCLGAPFVRTPVQASGGNNSPDCSGSFSFDFNVLIASGSDNNLVAGANIYAQHWYRDPTLPSTTALSNAIQFTIQP